MAPVPEEIASKDRENVGEKNDARRHDMPGQTQQNMGYQKGHRQHAKLEQRLIEQAGKPEPNARKIFHAAVMVPERVLPGSARA